MSKPKRYDYTIALDEAACDHGALPRKLACRKSGARRILRKLVREAVIVAYGPPGDLRGGDQHKRRIADRIAKELVP